MGFKDHNSSQNIGQPIRAGSTSLNIYGQSDYTVNEIK